MGSLGFKQYRGIHPRGDLFVLVTSSAGIDDADWQRYFIALEQAYDRCGGSLGNLPHLVITLGGMPNVRQRGNLVALSQRGGTAGRTAIVSDALAVRGAVTALGWFNPTIRSFRAAQFEAALGFLEVADVHARGVQREFLALWNATFPNVPPPSVSARDLGL